MRTRRYIERRYMRELLTRYPLVTEAAEVAGLNRSHLYKRLEVIGLVRVKIRPPRPRITDETLPPWKEFFRTQERAYWDGLLDRYKVMTQLAIAAEVNRTDLYKHMRRVGLDPEEIRRRQGRKAYGGNAAWRSLADDTFMASVAGNEPGAAVRRLPRPDLGRSTGARHG